MLFIKPGPLFYFYYYNAAALQASQCYENKRCCQLPITESWGEQSLKFQSVMLDFPVAKRTQ